MKHSAVLIALPALIALGACQSGAGGDSTDTVVTRLVADQLTARELADGQCGMFVWTRESKPRFIVFSQNDTSAGAIFVNSQETRVSLSARIGDPTEAQFPGQILIGQSGETYELALSSPETIDRGTRYSSGTLSYQTPDDWMRVVPVAGLSACR